MNIILYVMTILMALTLLTYARLENFRAFVGLKAQFKNYMELIEREPTNMIAENWYDRTTVKTHKSNSPRDNVASRSRLSFFLFLSKKEEREKDGDLYKQTRALAKELMTALYGKSAFFQEMLEQRGTFLEEILTGLEDLAEEFPEGKKFSKTEELANLELKDKDLHQVYVQMLHGEYPAEKKEKSKPVEAEKRYKDEADPEDKQDPDDEEDAVLDSEEAHSQAGYVSLIDSITVKNSKQVRVFLASRALLTAIYKDPDIVDAIIQKRADIYRSLRKNANKEQMTKEFKELFGNVGSAPEYGKLLDFTVTRTNPAKYD